MPARSFATVYEENVWTVYGFLAYRLRNRADAEDLTQQTFERALRAWPRFDPGRASPSTFLISIARNLLIDHHRRGRTAGAQAGSLETLDEARAPVAAGPEASVGISPELERALASLSDREQEVLALRFGGDLTGPEIAAMLDLSLANVQQIASRALRKLRALLDPRSAPL